MSRMRSNPRHGAVPEDFDPWLEGELPALLSAGGSAVEPRYRSARSSRPHWRLRLAAMPAVLGTKLLVGAGVIALAGAGVGVKTAVTGSPSPLVWSRDAQTTVQTCKAAASSPGIGSCVSGARANPHASGSPSGLAHQGGTSPPGRAIPASKKAAAQAQQSASGHGTSRPTPNTDHTPNPHPSPSHSPHSSAVK